MEEILGHLIKDASSSKFSAVKKSAQTALDLLKNDGQMEVTSAHVVRDSCLQPLQLALESKNKKLATTAINGIQEVFKDQRFQTSMELETEEKWFPIQILNTVISTPCLNEDLQVEIMKLLLNMTFTTAWCMNAKVITRVTQVYIDVYNTSTHSVRGTVRAALTQLLSSFTEKLSSSHSLGIEDGSDIMADFNPIGNAGKESMSNDIVTILQFLTDKLNESKNSAQSKPSIPLLLEGVYTIVSQAPSDIRDNRSFQEILWKHLCPTLISLLGTPNAETRTSLPHSYSGENLGRGSGCSMSAPNLQQSTAKTIYNIAIHLVDLMGPVPSLRPVLESLFHRMLLYPPPQHRLDAIKAVMELVKCPESLLNLASPVMEEGKEDFNKDQIKKNPNADIALLKLIVDSVQESCHCNDSAVCITSVQCVDSLLGSLEEISRGIAVTDSVRDVMEKYYKCLCNQDSSRRSSLSSLSNDGGATEETGDSVHVSEETQNSDHISSSHRELEDPTSEFEDDLPRINNVSPQRRQVLRQHSIIKEELERRYNKVGEKCYEKVEQQNAQELVSDLVKILPRWAQLGTISEVDEAMQQFASNFCVALYNRQNKELPESQHMAILNADGVYVAVISVLSLCLKLTSSGWYSRHAGNTSPPISEAEFMDDILGCGLLLFLSPAWLNEIYHQVCQQNILKQVLKMPNSPLLSLVKDIDGLGNHDRRGQFLTNSNSNNVDQFKFTENPDNDQKNIEAGKKFSRRVLSKLWDGLLDVLSVLLNGKSSCGISSSLALLLGTEGAREESHRAREAICMSLDGLQKAARLCCNLGLPQRCGSVFYQLASTSCVLLDSQKSPVLERKAPAKPVPTKNKPVRLHASHILSMDVVMTTGLEMGSHSADCWKHVFRCSAFISELEHTYFSRGNNQSNLPKVQQVDTEVQEVEDTELYGVSMVTAVPVAPRINVTELIRQSSIESGWDQARTGGGVLNPAQASQVLCGLSQEVDRLFEDAAENLNLSALLDFLLELCESSQQQLCKLGKHHHEEDPSVEPPLPLNALHLYRLQEVLMKIVHSDRPLLHMMRTWSVVSSYLIEAAGHKERNVSKMAVTCVHDFILAILSYHPELPYFHMNELLCKTFENMLCLEMCDGDVQDQIVCSICELVEACTADIRSGWRPLFGALRAVKIEYTTNEEVNEARQRHIAAVLDVFDVYLNTDNVLVFANATVDCILCLLKYVRGSGCLDDMSDDDSDSGSDFAMTDTAGESLCVPALGYLKQCSTILQNMWKMPACPVFNGAHRIHTHTSQQLVDPSLPHMNMDEFTRHYSYSDLHGLPSDEGSQTSEKGDHDKMPKECVLKSISELSMTDSYHADEKDKLLEEDKRGDCASLKSVDSGVTDLTTENSKNVKNSEEGSLSKTDDKKNETMATNLSLLLQNKPRPCYHQSEVTSLDTLDNSSGILHVWFLLIDGLAGSVASCPRSHQPETLDMLFQILRSAAEVPGPEFALFCVNHLLLPMIQSWLREGIRKLGYWESGATNFKQCCGMCTDLTVDFIEQFSGDCPQEVKSLVELMLKQLLDILIECVSQPTEVISRLGCSCIRHVLLSSGKNFSESLWQIGAEALEHALDVTTFHLRQLMLLFQADSDNFYGDVAQVKVAVRRDSSPGECQRLRHLAHQVFLLDSQVNEGYGLMSPDPEEDKSFVFLLYKPGEENSLNPSDIVIRIPFRNLVVGLLSNQLLLQTIGSVLLSVESLSIHNVKDIATMQGMLINLSSRNVVKMLQCLRNAYQLASEFDARPGLKFLIQKVAKTEVAVNLYKQTGASMVFYINALIQICSSLKNLDKDDVKHLSNIEHYSQLDVCNLDINEEENRKKSSFDPKLFLQLLRSVCDELCQAYVNILYDETTGKTDKMAEQQVFFLIAQPDDLSEVIGKRKEQQKKANNQSNNGSDSAGIVPMATVTLQEQGNEDGGSDEEVEEDDDDSSTVISDTATNTSSKSKRELREERDSKVYTIATDTLIKSLMTEYKKKKQSYAMPAFVKISKQKKSKPVKKEQKEVHDPAIEKQQKVSIMKDSEARVKSFTELLCTILGLFQHLSDKQFYTLLPTVFPCVNQLVCHAQDQRLRDALGDWLHRVGTMMKFIDDKKTKNVDK